jgi:heme/copper-type cytochrome/quinol oxidase subunit 2
VSLTEIKKTKNMELWHLHLYIIIMICILIPGIVFLLLYFRFEERTISKKQQYKQKQKKYDKLHNEINYRGWLESYKNKYYEIRNNSHQAR